MAENIIMPQLGESIAEGTIVKWLKEVGQSVEKDENVLLISTDKVEAEIPSPRAGVLLSIDVGPGETVAVGTVLGKVGAESELKAPPKGETKAEAKTTQEIPKPKPVEPPPEVARPQSEIAAPRNGAPQSMAQFYSPLVRKIAQENKLSEQELSSIAGSGREGRVSKKDVLDYLENRTQAKVPTAEKPKAQVPTPSYAPAKEVFGSEREIRKPISTMRRVIMENMIASRATSAHVTTFFEIDYTAIDKIRAAYAQAFKEEEQVSLTYTTFIAAAVCQTLKRHPYVNAEIQKDQIILKKDIHLGIAVAIDQPEPGLMVPVIRHADMQNLRGLAHAIHDLSTRVRTRKIKPDELSGGSFTITNPGNYGAVIGTPIINQPQVAILGVGQIKKQPCVMEVDGTDFIGIRNIGWLSLSFDHRLVDGATADIFMGDLKKTLEHWEATP